MIPRPAPMALANDPLPTTASISHHRCHRYCRHHRDRLLILGRVVPSEHREEADAEGKDVHLGHVVVPLLELPKDE